MAAPELPDWSVVCIAKEPPEVIRRFVAWHLDAGASRITLFFDDPEDPSISMVSHLAQVEAVPCTPAFWQSLGLDADAPFIKRQNRACKHGYDAAPHDWVLNIDADELLYVQGRSVAQFLAKMPRDVRSVRVQPAERVLRDGDESRAVFRLPMTRGQIAAVYREDAPYVIRNQGLVGHSAGKSIIRTGLKNIWLHQHYPLIRRGPVIEDRIVGARDGIYLLHYFNRGYRDWRRKLEYRLRQGGFRHRLTDLLNAALEKEKEQELRDIYARLHHIDERQFRILRRRNRLFVPDYDLAPVIARYFP